MLITRRQFTTAALPLLTLLVAPATITRAADSGGGGTTLPPPDPDPAFAAANAAYWADPQSGNANNAYWRNIAKSPAPPLREQITDYAWHFVGVPYIAGGANSRGWDCSGFVQWIYANFGITLPRTTYSQVLQGTGITPNNLLPGDLLFYDTIKPAPGHVGLYVGDGTMINALNERVGTVWSDIRDAYWSPRFYAARRIV